VMKVKNLYKELGLEVCLEILTLDVALYFSVHCNRLVKKDPP
jgi:hypothetical protein